jgi:hypothetical protein
MIIVKHRRNTSDQLQETETAYGIEVDIRSYGNELIIHHDPFADGERFDDWVKHYRHRLLILNVKEEGLEDRLIALMNAHGIEDFFFLDQSFPFLVRTTGRGERRCAVRVSEYETIDAALSLAGKADWVWVDCFNRFPLDGAQAARLQQAGIRICIASPELHGHTQEDAIPKLQALLQQEGIHIDAVCTKEPLRWQ